MHHPPLTQAALDIERHVAASGWDQPPRMYALVRTGELARREPDLAPDLADQPPQALSAIEQEDLPDATDLEAMLAQIAWGPDIDGVSLVVERIVVPPAAEQDLPDDPEEVVRRLAAHRERRDVRLLVAVLRDGSTCALLRQRAHDSDDQVAIGADIAPGLAQALAATLRD